MIIAIPERWHTSLAHLRRLCTRLAETVPFLILTGARVRILSLRPYIEDVGGGMGRHSHSYYEAVFFLEGNAHLIPEDTPLAGGAVLVHSPQRLHAWEPLTRVSRLVLSFDLLPPMALPSPLLPNEAPTLVSDLLRALGEVESQRPGWEDRARSLLMLVCSTLLASGTPLRNQPLAMDDMPDSLPTEVDQYLRDNYARPIRLADLAGHFGMCERTLTLHYHRLTGDSIMRRLRHIRLEAAQAMLLSTDFSLAEIGRRVGIPDPSYLCRCYRQQFGHPPGRQRRT